MQPPPITLLIPIFLESGVVAINDALLYQFKFWGIYCNSFILANYISFIIITFWVTKEVEVNLWHFEAGKAEITSQIQYESLTQRLPKLKAEKAIQKWLDWNTPSKRVITKILCLCGGDWRFNRSWSQTY